MKKWKNYCFKIKLKKLIIVSKPFLHSIIVVDCPTWGPMGRTLGDGFWISLVSSIGCFVVAAQFGLHLYHLFQDQCNALEGDTEAAKRLLLPCYKHLFHFMFGLYLLFGVVLLISLSRDVDTILSVSGRFHMIQYFLFLQQVIFTSVPLLFIYPYPSFTSFVNTAKLVVPWIIVVTPCWLIG